MKKGKVFFHPIEGSGPLTISWSSAPKGDAVEAKKGAGVGFFSKKGDLLCVIFDEVQSDSDHQVLEFDRDHIEITVKKGQVAHTLTRSKTAPRSQKKITRTDKRKPSKTLGTKLRMKRKASAALYQK